MDVHIKCLIQACQNLKIEYTIEHESENFVSIIKNNKKYYFTYRKVPLISAAEADICRDKDFTHSLISEVVSMPKSKSYLDPYAQEKYDVYKSFKSIEEITQDIISNFKFPLIVKRNTGSFGHNVFLCRSDLDIENSLNLIFTKDQKDYDFITIAQEYIETAKEYRVIVLNGEVQFIYLKDNSKGEFIGNLSPLHFENSKAKLVKNENLKMKIMKFLNPVWEKFPIKYCGVDVIEDGQGNLWLIELNSNPGFDHFVMNNGEDEVVKLYENIVETLM